MTTDDAADGLPDAALFARIFHESPIGKAVVDRRGRLLRVNAALGRFLGRQPAQLVGTTLADITVPEDLEPDLQLLAAVFAGTIDSYAIEKRYLLPDGSRVWGRLTVGLLRSDDGEVEYVLGAVQDITAEKAAQAEAERDRARLERALSVAAIAAWELDLGTGEFTASENLQSLHRSVYGTPVRTASEFLAWVHPADRPVVTAAIDPDDPGFRDLLNATFRLIDPEGGGRWLHVRGEVVRDDRRRPQRILGTGLDVSLTRAALEAQFRAERLHRTTVALARDAFLAVGAEGRIADWNEAAARLFGWSAAEVVGRTSAGALFPDDDRPDWAPRGPSTGLDPDGARRRIETTAVDRSGRRFAAEVCSVVLDDGRDRRVHAFVRDLSDGG